jgi:nucleotide-binding universal stress UspA family protein
VETGHGPRPERAAAPYPVRVFLNILAAVDGSASSRRGLEEAIDLARSSNALLTIITVAPPVSGYAALAGMTPDDLREEFGRWAAAILRDAAGAVPADLNAHTVQRAGSAGPEIVKELERGHYDLVVLGSRGRSRAQEGFFGSVNGYVHFHSRVPLLSIPERPGDAPPPPLPAPPRA